MRSRRQNHPRVVRESLQLIHQTFAEGGYSFAAVSTRFRRKNTDFIAFPKDKPQEMLLVRATERRNMVIHRYSVYPLGARQLVRKAKERSTIPIRWGGPAFVQRGARVRNWQDYVSKKSLAELQLLNGT